jgi:proton glutamate symport protein
LEGVAVILGVDAFLDMARTSVNLVGNCLASAVMARWEGELNLASTVPSTNPPAPEPNPPFRARE